MKAKIGWLLVITLTCFHLRLNMVNKFFFAYWLYQSSDILLYNKCLSSHFQVTYLDMERRYIFIITRVTFFLSSLQFNYLSILISSDYLLKSF